MDFILDPGLVLYLPFYELDGVSLMSKDACGNLATVTGALWTPQGRTFDGIDDCINCGKPASLNFQASLDFTWIFWVKTNTIVPAYQSIFSEHDSENYKFLGIQAGGAIRFDYAAAPDMTANIIAANTWHQIALVHTQNTTDYLVYLDGDLIDTLVSGGAGANTNNILLGLSTGNNFPFSGTMGEIMFYSRALTTLEIQQTYLKTRWRYV